MHHAFLTAATESPGQVFRKDEAVDALVVKLAGMKRVVRAAAAGLRFLTHADPAAPLVGNAGSSGADGAAKGTARRTLWTGVPLHVEPDSGAFLRQQARLPPRTAPTRPRSCQGCLSSALPASAPPLSCDDHYGRFAEALARSELPQEKLPEVFVLRGGWRAWKAKYGDTTLSEPDA